MKISKFYFGPGSPKNRFLRFVRNFFTKRWDVNLGITSETTWGSRVKRPDVDGYKRMKQLGTAGGHLVLTRLGKHWMGCLAQRQKHPQGWPGSRWYQKRCLQTHQCPNPPRRWILGKPPLKSLGVMSACAGTTAPSR